MSEATKQGLEAIEQSVEDAFGLLVLALSCQLDGKRLAADLGEALAGSEFADLDPLPLTKRLIDRAQKAALAETEIAAALRKGA